MDVFSLRDRVVDDYQRYVRGFVSVSEPNASNFVEDYFDAGNLWPEPLVQLNPSFEPARSVDELVGADLLHADCANFFRRRSTENDRGESIRLHKHQEQAILAAQTGASYVLSTGTGSGKSLAYFIPIVDHVLKRGPGQGVRAIVVYPMNALCDSQAEALHRFLDWGSSTATRRVTYAKYTGQEKDARRQEIWATPPDILLTNFAMLELILTRTDEQQLVKACEGLEFLVLDELHTYRGRQGADVAMLVRRVRDKCGAPSMRCVGTSATLATQGTREQRQEEIARVAARLFGLPVPAANVVVESVERATQGHEPAREQLVAVLSGGPSFPSSFIELARHPLAVWAEIAFGLRTDRLGRLERRDPRTLTDAARDLNLLTNVSEVRCQEHLRQLLLAGCHSFDPASGFPLFAFRLHQFISRGTTVYATPEPPTAQRHFSAEGQRYVPGDRSRRLYPLAFCRVCGQDYLVVALKHGEQLEPRYMEAVPGANRKPAQGKQLEPRGLDERAETGGDEEMGFVVVGEQFKMDDLSALPEEWLEERRENVVIRSSARKSIPRRIRVTPEGRVLGEDESGGVSGWFLPAPFRYCFGCQTTYASAREKDFSRLSQLSSEGRSTATTILSIAIVRALRDDDTLPAGARKLLSFTDNRQDASLQAGHFNDFIQVTLLRAAIQAAVERAGPDGLPYDQIAQRVAECMSLGFGEYASNREAQFAARRSTEDAFRDVVGYRVYHDLRRGWRVNAPNLEQVGLLGIEYDELDQLCRHQETWERTKHPDLVAATPARRKRACRAILNFMRRALAIKATYLDRSFQDQLRQRSYSVLRQPWAFDESEPLSEATALLLPGAVSQSREDVNLSRRSLLGRYLRKGGTWPDTRLSGGRLKPDEFDALIGGLIQVLRTGGYLDEVPGAKGAYRLNASTMKWTSGDGTVEPDPVRVGGAAELEDRHVNAFFAQLYQIAATNLSHFEAREHTAQVPAEERENRERRFETADLPVLYCSPTMELGVDIRDLNAVNLRNVPPTPANYAQRSGRAGRSGQPALVLSYCTSTSSHDQYYFRRRPSIVAGAVAPPRLDVANEDLVRAHVHAVWLAETGQDLYNSVDQLLDLDPVKPDLPLKDGVRSYVADPKYQRAAEARCRRILNAMQGELTPAGAPWYKDEWLGNAVQNAPNAFDTAINRWRHLYRSARDLQKRQNQILENPLTSADDRRSAERLRAEAEAQIKLLTVPEPGRRDVYSDFYSYRYFASEGFLPGYNFPRLPVTAYLPGRGQARDGRPGRDQEFLSRARFVAISEFGPRTIVYHEGSRYRIHRVVLPRDESGGHTQEAKFCTQCGYAHFAERRNVDRCENCDTPLDASTSRDLSKLLRLESVSTYRVDRINCDEEERLRLGYEITTHFRFASSESGRLSIRPVNIRAASGEVLATGKYGPATTLWRVNLGWNRRKDRQVYGFLLDRERGLWERSDQEPDASDQENSPLGPTKSLERVVPYVEDRRNALLLELASPVMPAQLLSLMYALKRGIEAYYQLEDSELGCEALPTDKPERRILLYEAAEGGAGVLVRLAEDADALAQIAREALAVCHFDRITLEDRHRTEGGLEDCEAACYDCLFSYSNQRFHDQLDRKTIPDVLGTFATSITEVGSGGLTRAEQREALLRACESDLERDFIHWLDEHAYRLPDRAQFSLGDHTGVYTQPDFYYDNTQACIYVDGHPHTFGDRAARDSAVAGKLEPLGYTVIRFQGADSWSPGVAAWPWVFGAPAPGQV